MDIAGFSIQTGIPDMFSAGQSVYHHLVTDLHLHIWLYFFCIRACVLFFSLRKIDMPLYFSVILSHI